MWGDSGKGLTEPGTRRYVPDVPTSLRSRRPRRLRREHVAGLGLLSLLLVAAYDPTLTPLRRLSAIQCDCLGGGTESNPHLSARALSYAVATTPGTETFLLPFNDTGIDLRGRGGASAQFPLSIAGLGKYGSYTVGWAGDGSSILYALQMPLKNGNWDLSDGSG